MMGLGLGLAVTGLAFATGPVRYPVRAALRLGGPTLAKRYERPVCLGLLIGCIGAILLAPVFGMSPMLMAALILLLLLAASDAAWRWLPPVWTMLLAAIGAIQLLYMPDPFFRMMEAGLVAGALLLLRQIFLWRNGTEALGLGDIWLAGAVALSLGAPLTFQVLGLAAALGIASFLITERLFPSQRRRMGVAFGTHICFISAIYLTWFTTSPVSAYT